MNSNFIKDNTNNSPSTYKLRSRCIYTRSINKSPDKPDKPDKIQTRQESNVNSSLSTSSDDFFTNNTTKSCNESY